MPSSTRLIRRRIKSVTNTRKITKAMEMVAASKMRKSVSAVLGTRPYAEAAWRAITEIARVTTGDLHPLLARSSSQESGRRLILLFSSDRGLCGGFNAHMAKTTAELIRNSDTEFDIVTIGKKGLAAARRSGWKVVASFSDMGNHPTVTEIRPIADLAISDFVSGRYDEVLLAFMDYRSTLVQRPTISPLLPIGRIAGLGDVDHVITEDESIKDRPADRSSSGFLFEPSPRAVLDRMLPRLVEAQIFQALLESSASEHSARMMAMRSASDAASEMIESLTLTYNQARQAGITAEIAEISSGKAALEK